MSETEKPKSVLPEDIQETLDIDPNQSSYQVNKDRLASLKHAIAGVLNMLRYQQSARAQSIGTVVIIALGLWLKIPRVEMAILIVTLGQLWTTEFINTSLEAAINLETQDYHPLARVAKDVAAGATLITTIIIAIVSALILLNPLLEKLGLS